MCIISHYIEKKECLLVINSSWDRCRSKAMGEENSCQKYKKSLSVSNKLKRRHGKIKRMKPWETTTGKNLTIKDTYR